MLLLTETAYRLLSMESITATDSKDCVVLVLGNPAEENGSLHPVQRFRVDAGVAVYRQQQCRQIIFSGGAVHNRHVEGRVMATYARTLGMHESAVIVEGDSRSTW